jgi:VanZ family protein
VSRDAPRIKSKDDFIFLPVIMAGGSGSRLRPLSRQLNLKQFLPLADANFSMLQASIQRLADQRLAGLGAALPRLICNAAHRPDPSCDSVAYCARIAYPDRRYSIKPNPVSPFSRLSMFMRYVRVLPVLAVLAIILFSGLKAEPVPQLFQQQDKLHHLLGFAALAFSLRVAFPRAQVVWLMAVSLTAALLIELGQDFLPQRTASLGDMLANTLGVLLGGLCSLALEAWLRRLQPAN